MRMELRKFNLLIGFFILSCVCFQGSIFSEIITLKSGQIVEGRIIEETDKYIKIDFMGTPLTYSKEAIKNIDRSKEEIVQIKIKPEVMSTKDFLAKIELLDNYIGKHVLQGYGGGMPGPGGPTSEYRESISKVVADIRSKINEIKILNVNPDCEKLKQLFVEVHDTEVTQLVKRIDNSTGAEESEGRRNEFKAKAAEYLKAKQEIQSRRN